MDEVLRKTLDRLSEDARQLLDWEAQRLTRLRRESGVIDMSGNDLHAPLCCEGHDHTEDEG